MYRSRLQRVEEKRNTRKAVLLLAGTCLVLGAIVIWGIPVLVQLAVFLGNLNSSKRPIDKSDIIPPAPPTILTTHEAINSGSQTIQGWAEPGSSVFLTLNKESVGSVITKDNGEFQFGSVNLNEGDNVLVAVAVDGGGNKSLESVPVRIYFWDKEPKLEVTNPSDGQTITGKESTMEIKGQTDSGVKLTVNGRFVVLGGEGNFVTNFILAPGENNLVVEAVDRAGNKARKELVVTYTP